MSKLNIKTVSISLSLFLALTYLLCIGFGLLLPQFQMWQAWYKLLPGFEWLTFTGFVIGLVESILYGFYIGGLFGLMYNFIDSKTSSSIWWR